MSGAHERRDRIEDDRDVRAALAWLASTTGDAPTFLARLERAQEAYRRFTSSALNLGQDPVFSDIGPDVVAAYLAQAKSLLDDRRSYDFALASKTVPWVKQMGRNAALLNRIPGARERAARMLSIGRESVLPDSAMFELVIASNYAAEGLDVAFVDEPKGQARTPDLRLSSAELPEPLFVECKRLGRGQYEQAEQACHRLLFRNVDVRGTATRSRRSRRSQSCGPSTFTTWCPGSPNRTRGSSTRRSTRSRPRWNHSRSRERVR